MLFSDAALELSSPRRPDSSVWHCAALAIEALSLASRLPTVLSAPWSLRCSADRLPRRVTASFLKPSISVRNRLSASLHERPRSQ